MEQEHPEASRSGMPILKISRVMAVIAAGALGAMMLITVADVVGRYFFLAPVEGTFEIVGILLVIAGSMGLGYCQLNKGNLKISIIVDMFRPRLQSGLFILMALICFFVAGMVCWRSVLMAWDYFNKDLGGTTITLNLPYWPFMIALAFGFGWACLIYIIDFVRSFGEVFKHGTD